MSDSLQLQSIALPDIAELQAATSRNVAALAEPSAGDFDDDSDWSDDCNDGHGPPSLRHSAIHALPSVSAAFAQADLQRQNDDLSSAAAAAAAAAAADFEAEHSAFSAPLRAHVARTVTTSTLAAYEAEDDEYASFGAVQRSDIFTDEVDAAIFGQQSPILKEGWLRKLARFGRDLNRYFVIAPLDTARMRPKLRRGSATAAKVNYAVFYYANQPQDLNSDEPCGIVALDASSTVESFSAGSKHAFCVRLTNAQQLIKRTLQSQKHTYVMSAESDAELQGWMTAMMQVLP